MTATKLGKIFVGVNELFDDNGYIVIRTSVKRAGKWKVLHLGFIKSKDRLGEVLVAVLPYGNIMVTNGLYP